MRDTYTIVVTGATGRVGGQVVAQLAGSGITVRAVGRNLATVSAATARYGAEPFAADLTDPATLAPALDGADAAFLVFPSVAGDHAAPATVATLAEHVRRVVYLSAFGVPDDPAPPTTPSAGGIMGSHALLESLIAASAKEWTFLRASGFAANTLVWAAQTNGGGDELRWFGPGITRSLVHEADLAAVGVRALLDDGHHRARYHLTGPEQLTQAQQVAAVGAALGRPLRFIELDPDDSAAQLFPGLPTETAEQIVRAQLAMIDNPEPMTREVQRLTARPALTYARWARDHVSEFRGTTSP
jgi:uncharacterized protein YbjT (DUF2867 family)